MRVSLTCQNFRWPPFLVGLAIPLLLYACFRRGRPLGSDCAERAAAPIFKAASEWSVIRKPTPSIKPGIASKASRPWFIATELGIREPLLMVLFAQSPISVVLNRQANRSGIDTRVFMENSRLRSVEMKEIPTLTSYQSTSESATNAAVLVMNSLYNLTLHEKYDWLFFTLDSTYTNVFELKRLVGHLAWSTPLVLGIPDGQGRCKLEAGILVSNPGIQLLIQGRNFCNSITADYIGNQFSTCLHRATNLSCMSTIPMRTKNITKYTKPTMWRYANHDDAAGAAANLPLHERVAQISKEDQYFNSSLTVSRLLSEMDVTALHKHFARVELSRLESEERQLEEDLRRLYANNSDGLTPWPLGIPTMSLPPNRYQIPVWEYFTEHHIFKNQRDNNYSPLMGNDRRDIEEVVQAARQWLEAKSTNVFHGQEQFKRFISGYRLFTPLRGIDYSVDLEYMLDGGRSYDVKRVRLSRPIHTTQLLDSLPYATEDADITIVLPVEEIIEANAARVFLSKHANICRSTSGSADSRQIRIILVVRWVSAFAVKTLGADLLNLQRRCKSSTDTALFLATPNNGLSIAMTAMDEAVDHYGQQTLYLLLSPHAEYQEDFLDRVRLNTLENYQISIPIPFAEFNPKILKQGAGQSSKAASFTIHKDRGVFDEHDFSALSVYGGDYLRMRRREDISESEGWNRRDLSSLFMDPGSRLHILRTVEPALRIRYHLRLCPRELNTADSASCHRSALNTFANKFQMASLVFG